MKLSDILTIEDFVEASKEWDATNFLSNAERLKIVLREHHNLKRGDWDYETYHRHNDDIGKLIDQLSTLLWRCSTNFYDKPLSETWEQYQINKEIIRRFVPNFECPSWANGQFSD